MSTSKTKLGMCSHSSLWLHSFPPALCVCIVWMDNGSNVKPLVSTGLNSVLHWYSKGVVWVRKRHRWRFYSRQTVLKNEESRRDGWQNYCHWISTLDIGPVFVKLTICSVPFQLLLWIKFSSWDMIENKVVVFFARPRSNNQYINNKNKWIYSLLLIVVWQFGDFV